MSHALKPDSCRGMGTARTAAAAAAMPKLIRPVSCQAEKIESVTVLACFEVVKGKRKRLLYIRQFLLYYKGNFKNLS